MDNQRNNSTTRNSRQRSYERVNENQRNNIPSRRRPVNIDDEPEYSSSPRNNRRLRSESYVNSDDLANVSWVSANRKKLLIGLGAIGVLAVAIGIGNIISNAGKVEIASVQPATITAQQPYQDCHQVSNTSYSRNHKNGTEGAVIGGVGGAAVGGLVTHSWVGAGVGAAVGAVGGDLIERSHQPDYVAHHGSSTQCQTAYRQIQVPIGYQVGYLSDGNVIQITTQHQPQLGTKVKLTELEADQVTPQQQQQLVQQAIGGGNNQTAQPAAAQ